MWVTLWPVETNARQLALRGASVVRKTTRPKLTASVRRARRAAFIARANAAARWAGSTLELDLADDIALGSRIRLAITPRTHNRLIVRSRTIIESDVLLRLGNGTVDVGERCVLRSGVVLNVGGGSFSLGRSCVLSWGTVVHCSERVALDEMVGVAEQVTIADTNHYFTAPDEHFWHNARSKPVCVGRNTWLCPKVSVTPGSHVGSYCIIASNSVVVGVIPDGSLASGMPAKARPLDLPWQTSPAAEAPTERR